MIRRFPVWLSARPLERCPLRYLSGIQVVALAVSEHFDFEPFTKRVDDTDADAVKAARDLIAVMVEFSARVQRAKDDFERALFLAYLCVARSRECPAVVPSTGSLPSAFIWMLICRRYPASASSIELSTSVRGGAGRHADGRTLIRPVCVPSKPA